MDTFIVLIFFFLANSSIALVGSAPAERRYKIGLLGVDSSQISVIVSVTGAVYSSPRTERMNY